MAFDLAYSVKCRCLAGLLFQIHLRKQIFDACVDRRFRIFVDIHAAVLVQIDPALVIDFFAALSGLRQHLLLPAAAVIL